MKKAVSELVKTIEDGYRDSKFEVLSIITDENGLYLVTVREAPVEEDK